MLVPMEHYVIFSALYLPSMGGVEKYTHNLAAALGRAGRRVTIVTSRLSDDDPAEEERDGARIVRLPSRPLLNGRLPLPKRNGEYRMLMAALDNAGGDHVVVNTRFYPHSLEGLAFARRHGVEPILVEHGSAHLSFGATPLDAAVVLYEHGITARVKRYHPRCFAVSKRSAEWMGHFGLCAEGVLSNAIDAASFRGLSSGRDFRAELGLAADAFVASFIGRLVPEKGVGALIEASRAIASVEGRPVAFLLAGEGPLALEARAAQGPSLRLLGRLDEADVSALLATSDALCLPSRSEGFATCLLEAAAWGVPPVTTAVGGADELVGSGDCGVLLASPDGAEVARAVRALADDPDGAAAKGRAIRMLVEGSYSWDETAARLIEVCESSAISGTR